MSRRRGSAPRRPTRRWALLALGAGCVVLAFGLGLWWGGASPPRPSRPIPAKRGPTSKPSPSPAVKAPAAPPAAKPRTRPRVALVIDDLGNSLKPWPRLAALDIPLTVAILPHTPRGPALARRAHARGLEVMLHLPMEPVGYPRLKPGPGALLCAMSPTEMSRVLARDLATVPFAAGVNNHMGSLFSRHARLLEPVLRQIKKRGLYYLDSFTAADSQGMAAARRLGLPTGRRDVFLDHRATKDSIDQQMERLLKLARRRGRAIAIAHPHPVTFQALARWAPRLRREVELVRVSRILTPAGP